MLFAFHDAFDGSVVMVSDRIEVEKIRTFCTHLGVTSRREVNENKRHPEQLRRFLMAMENARKDFWG